MFFQLLSLHIDRGANFQVLLTNMIVTKGASNFKIEKLKWVYNSKVLYSAFAIGFVCRVNLNEPSFDFIIHLPRIEFRGKYDLKVRVVLVDLVGKGDIIGVFGESKKLFFRHFFL